MEELVFSGFVGIDWGEKKHQVCVLDGAGRVRGNRAFSHRGKGLRALVKWLKKLTGVSPASVAVVIERPDGPVVATLLAAGFAVYAINPRQSSNLRKVFDHAGNGRPEGLLVVGGGGEDPPGCDAPGAAAPGVDRAASGTDGRRTVCSGTSSGSASGFGTRWWTTSRRCWRWRAS